MRLLVNNIRQLVVVTEEDVECITGNDMNNIKVISDPGCQLAVFVDDDGTIAAAGHIDQVAPLVASSAVHTVDAEGGCVLPGLVDAHSHPVFAGDRVHEFAMKLAGATYEEVQAAGGGIHFTTHNTRRASQETLTDDFQKIASEMLSCGTTTLEAKSGYGLDTETEMKMLRVLSTVKTPLEISATFCGAHAVPKGSDELTQTEMIVNETLPLIATEKAAGRLACVENIDAFCEKGNFGVECTEKIMVAGAKIGLAANFHAEELSCLGGARMGARIGARAMSHLEEVCPEGIREMAAAKCSAVLLPSTAFILRLQPPPAREMIEQGVIVSLGSDFNPNAFCLSMPTIMHLACVTMKLSMPEALVAATINAAYSIGRGRTHGAIAKGRVGDMIVLKAASWEHLIYRLAGHSSVIRHVIKKGVVVYSREC